MFDLKNIEESKGKVLSFTYCGGTEPFAQRTVYVLELNKENIVGWDFDRIGIRQFKKNKVSEACLLNNVTYVNLKLLPKAFHDGTKIKDQFINDGKRVFIDKTNSILIAIASGTNFNVVHRHSGTVLILNGINGTLRVELPKDKGSIVSMLYKKSGQPTPICKNTTAEKLQELIVETLSL